MSTSSGRRSGSALGLCLVFAVLAAGSLGAKAISEQSETTGVKLMCDHQVRCCGTATSCDPADEIAGDEAQVFEEAADSATDSSEPAAVSEGQRYSI